MNKGSEFLVPAYRLFDIGIYAIVAKQIGAFNVSGGIRYDQRSETGNPLYLNDAEEVVTASSPDAIERFTAFDDTFRGFSGSIGGTWQISKTMYTKLNVSRGFRDPNIAELGSNGVHEGTFRYEIGNHQLQAESSLQFDWAIGLHTHHVSAELDLFNNSIDHFIFTHKLSQQAVIHYRKMCPYSNSRQAMPGFTVVNYELTFTPTLSTGCISKTRFPM